MTWRHPDWFTQDENTLLKLIKDHNTAFKISLSNQTNESRDNLWTTRAKLQAAKRKAKRSWQWQFANKCQCENFQTDPKSAWDTVFQLIEGFNGHHQTFKPKCFANEQGKIATTNKENIRWLAGLCSWACIIWFDSMGYPNTYTIAFMSGNCWPPVSTNAQWV